MVALGIGLTVRLAAFEVRAGGQVPLTTTSYEPASAAAAELIVSRALGAPATWPPFTRLTPSLRHRYVRPAPEAVTVNVAVLPAHTFLGAGWAEMAGSAFTVTVRSEEHTSELQSL